MLQSDPSNPANKLAQVTFIRQQMVLSVPGALTTPQLSKIRKESPEDLSEALTRLLSFYNNQLNLAQEKRLSSFQTALLSNEIITRYWYLKFDEIAYVLREGVTGKFGKLYGTFDAMTIHGWMDAYIKGERDSVVEEQALQRANAYKDSEKNFKYTEEELEGVQKYIEFLKQFSGYTEGIKDEVSKDSAYQEYRKQYLASRLQPEQTNKAS
ncbi:hypothetical protein AHMF7605_11945 [Adhaeribacter arboris]|uniref:Uncharacterized protein n=1 Tax=Adhaeribacter arboris TaxID=2072846 RepID=A0A2T2YFC1_9BACT|nr:hypothetical protein AHMF7605_11945 [Adhaeribacter arboris]